MNAKKCAYTLFSKKPEKNRMNLSFKNEMIPYNSNPVFLGITLDERLNFAKHFSNIECRAAKRINIIKIFCHKSWHLNHSTLLNIYRALIGSIFNYSFFCIKSVAHTNIQKLQIIQDRAIRCIYREQWNCSSYALEKLSGVLSVKKRLTQLGCKYLAKALMNNNLLTRRLVDEYFWSRSSIKRKGPVSTPLCLFTSYLSILYTLNIFIFLTVLLLVWAWFNKFLDN